MTQWFTIFSPSLMFIPFASRVYVEYLGTKVYRVFYIFGVRVALYRLVKESDY